MKKIILLQIFAMVTILHAQNSIVFNAASDNVNTSYSIRGGYLAGLKQSGSTSNAFLGAYSGYSTTSGSYNNALGAYSLYSNTTGNYNSALGWHSMYSNTTGSYNTGIGHDALVLNTTGNYNVGVGYYSLAFNPGSSNTGIGYYALNGTIYATSATSNNTAVGYESLEVTTGQSNTGIGANSLSNNSSGNYNTALGYGSLNYITTGSNNIGIGYNAGPSSNYTNTISIGYGAAATVSNSVVIGNSSTTSIGGQVGWSTLSDGRFKTNVKEDISGLAFINQLRPVSYTLDANAFDAFVGVNDRNQVDSSDGSNVNANQSQTASPNANSSVRKTGFIAQDVETAMKKLGITFSGLVIPANEKDYYSIRYSDFVVPLVKAVQELSAQAIQQNKKIDSLSKVIANLKSAVTNPTNSLGTQAVLYQNSPNPFSVSTQITMSIPETSQTASLIIYNLQGAQIKSIPVSGRGGNSTITISGGELSAGMYLYTLIVDGQPVDTKRMILTN